MDSISRLAPFPSVSSLLLCSKPRHSVISFYHLLHYSSDRDCRLFAAAYQETSIVIWDAMTGKPERILSGHEKPVTCLRWGGTDLIYSSSQDRTIRVWRSTDGVLCRRLDMHGHWINCLALSVDYVLRTGPFDPADAVLVKPPIPATAEGDEKSKFVVFHRLNCQDVIRVK